MTRNLTNYHSHCSLCDGRAPMEDFVREAVRRGFASYGISSHAPLPFPAVWTLDRGDVTTYLSEIERPSARISFERGASTGISLISMPMPCPTKPACWRCPMKYSDSPASAAVCTAMA